MEELYKEFLEYFKPYELVSKDCYEKYKGYGDNFFLSKFDPRLLKAILIIRISLDKSVTINDWKWRTGGFTQRGLRDTSTAMVQSRAAKNDPWLSGHVIGMAVDFNVKGMTAVEVRQWIVDNEERFDDHIRLERNMKGQPITWVHLDVCYDPKNPKIYLFDV